MRHGFWMLIFALWILSACTPAGTEETLPPAATRPANNSAGSLVNSQWRLTSFGGPEGETPIIEGSSPTLEFQADNQAGGSGGCNSFGARYEVQGSSLAIRELVSTLMACAEQPVTDQEVRYYDALQTAVRYEISGDQLTIWYGDGSASLNFVRAAQ